MKRKTAPRVLAFAATAASLVGMISPLTVAAQTTTSYEVAAEEAVPELQLADVVVPAPANTQTDQITQNHLDQITRLYLTTLGRLPDEAGQQYWAELLINGHTPIAVIRYMLETTEATEASSGDLVVDAYKNALGRTPDTAGYQFWDQYDPVAAVAAISDSAEHIAATRTLPPPKPQIRSFSGKAGWVDAGHGVFVPPIMLEVRRCESTHNYTAANLRSSARGAYQFLTGSWVWYGHAARYDAPQAHFATPAQQDEAAALTWLADGTAPWNASRHCWG
jgi:hypothetical protein